MNKTFNCLMKISVFTYILLLILGIMLKTIMPTDLIANYNFLSTMTLKQRINRGLNLIDFYKTEYEIGVIKKTIVLDFLNMLIFIPFGILISHCFKKNKVINTLIITFIFSLIIELFQLTTIIGAFMLNDLIINVFGSIIGAIIYIIVIKTEKYKLFNILLIVFLGIVTCLNVYLLNNLMNNIDVYIDILK